ncbi:hypothetical protein IJ707_04220 [bacterium]|nr:hypothetical protein [bacterium]
MDRLKYWCKLYVLLAKNGFDADVAKIFDFLHFFLAKIEKICYTAIT